jgi:hypothetical protein
MDQIWNGSFFTKSSLKDLGLRVQLNHLPGDVCATSYPAASEFVVYDLLGIHTVNVDYCRCEEIEHREQLMRACWWPATPTNPKTCATFDTLRFFQLLNCLGKVSAHDFLLSLEYLTDNNGLNPPPVCPLPISSIPVLMTFLEPP